jgi:hypothetical protein
MRNSEGGEQALKGFLKGLAFIVVLVLIIWTLNGIYTISRLTYVNVWSDSTTVANFYQEEENSIDVLIFGSSTASNAIQPAVIWNEQHITAYNLSTEGQPSLAAYYLLVESRKYQHPKVGIINAKWVINNITTDIDYNISAYHLALDYMKLSSVKVQAAMDIAARIRNQSAIDYIFPLYTYHSRDDITQDDFNTSLLSAQHPLKGACLQMRANTITYDSSNMEPGNASDDSVSRGSSDISSVYVEKMIELCRTRNINVLLLSMPLDSWNWSLHQEVQAFADDFGVPYLDMNADPAREKIQMDPHTDFAEGNHESIMGSLKTSQYIASYLAENYPVERSYSNHVASSFNESYATYAEYYKCFQLEYALKSSARLEAYLSRLAGLDGYIIVIAAKDEFYGNLTEEQKSALRSLGLKTDFNADIYRYSYVAIIDSGHVIYEACSPDKIEYKYKVTEDMDITAISAGFSVGNLSSILFSDEEYSPNKRGLNIVVFDKSIRYIADSVNFDTDEGTDAFRSSES